ncbi:amidohydrolase [Hyphococcus sp. DH-69]|uniref:amidohydrolase n=1 Tax=Hyphococcus formosus TaxID=3143534 RepID=UPI00398A96AA
MRSASLLGAVLLGFVAACNPAEENSSANTEALTPPAEKLFINGRIYTANNSREFMTSMALRGDEIVGVGNIVANQDNLDGLIGQGTEIIDLEGKLVLPGLHDAHLHPIGAMPIPSCNLENIPMSLADIVAFAEACLEEDDMANDEWITIELWNFAAGNQPGEDYKTIRQALDAVSSEKPVILLGSDGHHYAVNSVALARAKNDAGAVVGFSAETLATDFAALAPYIGVDDSGEPNGKLTEDYALSAIGAGNLLSAGIEKRRASPELMMDVTLPRGITSFLDAAADPNTLDIYDRLVANDAFHARAHLALFYDPSTYRDEQGVVDFDTLLSDAQVVRKKYERTENIEADFLKLFADGVIEGDPLSEPPTLPNAAFSRDYLQPIFEWDEESQWVKVSDYIDTDSELCVATRAAFAAEEEVDIAAFKTENGFHPQQCAKSNGVLQHPEDVIMDYVQKGDAAGFTFHIHAIGDRGIHTALNAVEEARTNNDSNKNHIITHLQVVHPDDINRFAANDIYASFTFAWAVRDPQYDTTVIPFIDRVDGPGGMYDPAGYYIQNGYPAESIREGGATLIAGSDAPVDTKDPRPFTNIEAAVSRSIYDLPPMNIDEAISIYDAVDAYTINAAKALKQDNIAGSIEPGKKADFIILDQDIFALVDEGETAAISDTKVLETWFGGKKVYAAEE